MEGGRVSPVVDDRVGTPASRSDTRGSLPRGLRRVLNRECRRGGRRRGNGRSLLGGLRLGSVDDEGEVEEEGRVSLGGDCWGLGLGLGLGVLGGMGLGDGRLVGGIGVRWWMICSSGIGVGG